METIRVNDVEITLDKEGDFKTTFVKRPNYPDQERGIIWYFDLAGKRKRVYCEPSPTAWHKRWMKLRDELAAGIHNANKANLASVAMDALRYREGFVGKPQGIRPQSHENDVRHLKRHVLPVLGDKQIHKITVGDINMFIDKLMLDGKAPKTQRSIIHSLNMVYKYAIDKGIVFSNPCARESRRNIKGGVGNRDGYSADEVRHILALDMPSYSKALFSFAALTGLAANELQGLLWDSLDIKSGSVTVRRTGYRGALQETKTEFRVRTIPLPPSLIALMREWHLQCPSPTYVFPSATNVMADQKHWAGLLKTLCKHAEVGFKGIGGFRKFYHTQMELDGVPASIRKYRMGHSKKSNIAEQHYTVTDLKLAQSSDDIQRIAGRVLS